MIILIFTILSVSLIPIPKRSTGIKYGPISAPINIEIFVDITCPACASAYSTIQKIIEAYPTQINIVYHFFDIPSHTWSYLLTRTIFACDKESKDFSKAMLDGLFGKFEQIQFYPATLKKFGEDEVKERAFQYAVQKTGIDRKTLELNYDDSEVVQIAREEFKYSFIKNLEETPTVYVNGVRSDLYASASVQDWKDLIDSLLD